MDIVSENKCFGGTQRVYTHASRDTGTDMTFGLFLPPGTGPFPVITYLSGLTCTHENAMVKAGAQAHAAQAGVALFFPDTSPRGKGVADDAAYDLGQGAGFYVDATQEPWSPHFHMKSYILSFCMTGFEALGLDIERQSIMGHSMGGHGALTLAALRPTWFRSVSAFAPICNPTQSEWGQKQFTAYLGSVEAGADYDATLRAKRGNFTMPVLTDTGTADEFLHLLGTEAFSDAMARYDTAEVRMQEGYDHSYFFVSTFMGDHIAFHAKHLHA
ncbi:MAG: S-formylglutathione hydrolase [Paracoccaceae bacterium]